MIEKKNDKQIEKGKPNNFHVRVKPSAADWLRKQVNADAPSVPAVIKDIGEAKRRDSEG